MAQRGVGPRRRTVRREEAKDDEQEQGTATLRLATYAPVFPCMPQTVLSAELTQPWSCLQLRHMQVQHSHSCRQMVGWAQDYVAGHNSRR